MCKIRDLIFLALLIVNFQSYGQTYQFTTSGFSNLERKPGADWGEWSELELVNIVVQLDTNKNRITIFSQEVQVFEIMDYLPLKENDSDAIYSFTCKDIEGINCTLSIITRKKQSNRKQLYISYDDYILLYNIFNSN